MEEALERAAEGMEDDAVLEVLGGALGGRASNLKDYLERRAEARAHYMALMTEQAHGSTKATESEGPEPVKAYDVQAPGFAEEARLSLTQRQFEILQLMASGRSRSEIAEAMGLSPATVANVIAETLRTVRGAIRSGEPKAGDESSARPSGQ